MALNPIKGFSRLKNKINDVLGGILKKFGPTITSVPNVSIGFFEDAEYGDGLYVAQVAFWNEFGTKSSPARPFMRTTVSAHKSEWCDLLKKFLIHFKGDVDKALQAMGAHIADQIKDQIIATNSPPNSNITNILKNRFPKGGYDKDDFLKAVADSEAGVTAPSGKVLNWSGKMLQSVTWEVNDD